MPSVPPARAKRRDWCGIRPSFPAGEGAHEEQVQAHLETLAALVLVGSLCDIRRRQGRRTGKLPNAGAPMSARGDKTPWLRNPRAPSSLTPHHFFAGGESSDLTRWLLARFGRLMKSESDRDVFIDSTGGQ